MSFGGTILFSKPWVTGQLRNYIGVFFLSGLISLASGLWIFFMIDGGQNSMEKERNSKDAEEFSISETNEGSQTFNVFDLNNILAMIRTCLKRRKNNKHIQLWHLMACLTLALICSLGEMSIAFQFVQRVFAWNAKYFSNIKTVTSLIPAIGGVILPAILVEKLHLDDYLIGIIGSISIILAACLKGGILEPFAYFFGEALGVSTTLLAISLRSIMSKIIESGEIGQIFTIISAIQSVAPILSSAFYTLIFNETLEVYPGLVYHLVALLSFYPLIFICWMSLSQIRQSFRQSKIREQAG
ncbi:putative peptidoglycan muropeptide transporter SLC46 [Brevipalpus obovatus]|uniref:putative peptidoglycan muropeptide transporter SLC46 n=1 Tax=Brevipalpus obovatus TaxID=246614 RepID=UPI003D9F2024